MRVIFLVVCLCTCCAFGEDAGICNLYEEDTGIVAINTVDVLVLEALQEKGISPANKCSDNVFVRRVYLDILGTLPDPAEARAFLKDNDPAKRARLIDTLLERPEFADYWALKWGDILRVKAEYPINLWPNAVQSYHRWIHDAITQNMPYDQFARALLTSSGSNFRVPPVNFYRAIQGRTPEAIAQAVALTFMGTRLDRWPEDKKRAMAAFFSRVVYKQTNEWKEEIVLLDPANNDEMDAVLPDENTVKIPIGEDPRRIFADWLIQGENPWFARALVNRVWAWLMGRGIIHEPDDIREDNPASNPPLLAYLQKDFVDNGYDLRLLFKRILNSRTYQQSSIPRTDNAEAESLFAFYAVRRLDAEVLIDALNGLNGKGESYSSPIPEPFTFIPESQRTITLADGSVTSSFLEMFGRPARDTGLESERNNQPSDEQRLYLLNSTDIKTKLDSSQRLRALAANYQKDPPRLIQMIYLTILSRFPSEKETETIRNYLNSSGLNPKQVMQDVVWSLINTKEFLYRH